jgi:hypothetical protein
VFNIGDIVLEKRDLPNQNKTIINHVLGIGLIVKKHKVHQYFYEDKTVFEYDVYWIYKHCPRIRKCFDIDLLKI